MFDPGNHKICPKCSRYIPLDATNCTQCGHDQRMPVPKKPGPLSEIAHGVIIYCISGYDKVAKEILKHVKKHTKIDKSQKNRISVETLLTQLAVGYLVFDSHFVDHPKRDELNRYFISLMEQYLSETFRSEYLPHAHRQFHLRVQQYFECLRDENWERKVPKLFQAHIESIEFKRPFIGPDWATPDAFTYMFYAVMMHPFM